MGVTYGSCETHTGTPWHTEDTWSHAVAEDLLLVVVEYNVPVNPSADKISSVTFGSEALARVAGVVGASGDVLELWKLTSPTPGTEDITVSYVEQMGDTVCTSLTYDDVDLSAPVTSITAATVQNFFVYSHLPQFAVVCLFQDDYEGYVEDEEVSTRCSIAQEFRAYHTEEEGSYWSKEVILSESALLIAFVINDGNRLITLFDSGQGIDSRDPDPKGIIDSGTGSDSVGALRALGDSGVGSDSVKNAFRILESRGKQEVAGSSVVETSGWRIGAPTYSSVTRDPNTGRLFVAYRKHVTTYNTYIKYSDDEGVTWSTAEFGVSSTPGGIFCDSTGVLHLIYYASWTVWHVTRSVAGVWGTAEAVYVEGLDDYTYGVHGFMDANDKLHLVITHAEDEYEPEYIWWVYWTYWTWESGVGWTGPADIGTYPDYHFIPRGHRIAVDSEGRVLFCSTVYYNYWPSDYRAVYWYYDGATWTMLDIPTTELGFERGYFIYDQIATVVTSNDDFYVFALLDEWDPDDGWGDWWGMAVWKLVDGQLTVVYDGQNWYPGRLSVAIDREDRIAIYGSGSPAGMYAWPFVDEAVGDPVLMHDDLGTFDATHYSNDTLGVIYFRRTSGSTGDYYYFSEQRVLNELFLERHGKDYIFVYGEAPDIVDSGTGMEVVRVIKSSIVESRNHPQTVKLYLAYETPRAIWKGRVTYARGQYGEDGLIDSDYQIRHEDGANVAPFDVSLFMPDLTVLIGTTDGGREHGKCRVKSIDGSFLHVVADPSCVWEVGDYITITDQHTYWPRPHRVEVIDEVLHSYKDLDFDTRTQRPVPIMGPPVCAFLDPDTNQVEVSFDGSRSYLVQPDSRPYTQEPDYEEGYLDWEDQGITDWDWWLEGANDTTPSGRHVVATYANPGRYVAKLTVTALNSESYSTFRNVWIFDREDNAPLDDFQLRNFSGDLNRHGWDATVQASREMLDEAKIPNGAQVVLFAEETFGGPPRTSIKMVGWIKDSTINIREQGFRDVTLRIYGLQEHLATITNYPVYVTQIASDAPAWSYFPPPDDGLTVRKALYFLIQDHWTLTNFTDVFLPDDHNNFLAGHNFPEGSLGQQLDSFVDDIQARWAVDHGGALHVFSWPNYLPVTGHGQIWRFRYPVVYELAGEDVSSVQVQPRIPDQVCMVQVEGVMAFQTGAYAWSIDTAPGDIRGFSGDPILVPNQVIGTGGFPGSQGYELAQMVYAEESRREEFLTILLAGNYPVCDIVPEYGKVSLTYNPYGNLRGYTWNGEAYWVVGVHCDITVAGSLRTRLTLFPETQGYGRIFSQSDAIQFEYMVHDDTPSSTLMYIVDKLGAPKSDTIPALMGDGAGHVEGPERGTTWVRLYGDRRYTVLAMNRDFKQINNRSVLVEHNPDQERSGIASGVDYRVVDIQHDRENPSEARETISYQIHRGELPVPGILEVKDNACPTELPVEGDEVYLIGVAAKTRTSGSATIRLTRNGSVVNTVYLWGGSGYTSRANNPLRLNVGDYLDVNITSVGTPPPQDLIVTAVCKEYGV